MPGVFKGTLQYKIEWGLIYWPSKYNLQIKFFRNLEKNVFSSYMENTLNGEKVFHDLDNKRTQFF